MWQKLRKILGTLTDILIKGRQAGLWTENQTLNKPSPLEKPHVPGDK